MSQVCVTCSQQSQTTDKSRRAAKRTCSVSLMSISCFWICFSKSTAACSCLPSASLFSKSVKMPHSAAILSLVATSGWLNSENASITFKLSKLVYNSFKYYKLVATRLFAISDWGLVRLVLSTTFHLVQLSCQGPSNQSVQSTRWSICTNLRDQNAQGDTSDLYHYSEEGIRCEQASAARQRHPEWMVALIMCWFVRKKHV